MLVKAMLIVGWGFWLQVSSFNTPSLLITNY